jgi:hypothetical protein
MRVTTFSVAATLLLAAGIATFWPGRNAAPGVAAVVAQVADPVGPPAGKAPAKPEPAKNSDPFKPDSPPEKTIFASVLEEKLNQITALDPVETPLKDLVATIYDLHGRFPILLNTKKLDEAGVSIDTPITKRVAGLRLSTALDLILDELDLTYVVVRDELVLITTPEDARSKLEVRVYDCRDLLAVPGAGKNKAAPEGGGEGAAAAATGTAPPMPGGYGGVSGVGGGMMVGGMGYGGPMSEHDVRASRLINIIMTNVDDQSWQMAANPPLDENQQPKRGRGMISEYDGLIVVTQTAQTHRNIEHVLEMLRRASGLEVSKTSKVVR